MSLSFQRRDVLGCNRDGRDTVARWDWVVVGCLVDRNEFSETQKMQGHSSDDVQIHLKSVARVAFDVQLPLGYKLLMSNQGDVGCRW